MQCTVLLPVTPDSSLLPLVHCSVLFSLCCSLLCVAQLERHTTGAAESNPCSGSSVYRGQLV